MISADWAKLFRRKIERNKNPRLAVQYLRQVLGQQAPSDLFKMLEKYPLFKNAASQNRTPRQFSKLWVTSRLQSQGAQADLAWLTEVIILFQNEIESFLKTEIEFEQKYIVGDWAACLNVLDHLEEGQGLSLWLISRRLTVLSHLGHDLGEQYADSLIASSPEATILSWLVYIWAYRADLNVTPGTYLRVVESSLTRLTLPDPTKVFLRYYALSTPPKNAEECSAIIMMSETAPLIDRYICLLDSLQLLACERTKGETPRDLVLNLVSRLMSAVNDHRLILLHDVVGPKDYAGLVDRLELTGADLYTIGNYADAVQHLAQAISDDPGRVELYALLARACLRTEVRPVLPDRVVKILHMFASFYALSIDNESATVELSREVLAGAHRSLTSSIRALFSSRVEDANISKLAIATDTLNGSRVTPMQFGSLPVKDPESLLAKALEAYPDSASLALQQAVLRYGQQELDPKLLCRLPKDQAALYGARALVHLKRYDEAIALLHDLDKHPMAVVANDARQELFLAFTSSNHTREALRLVAKAYQINERLHSLFHLEPLLGLVESNAVIPFDEIALSICYYIQNRFGGDRQVGAQADAAEEFALSKGANLPSKIIFDPQHRDNELVPLYLSQVCSMPILDKFMEIDNINEAELERLEICRRLSEIDSTNRQGYLEEIREITRRRVVRDRFEQVERTKIYVDTDGVKRQAEKNLRDSYARLVVTLADDTHGSERLEVMRQVQRLLSEVQADGVKIHFPDLPANERERLFDQLVEEVMAMLVSSQEYGLEAYLSTRVRHGTMGNQLRSAFEVQSLLTQRDRGRYQPDHFWSQRLGTVWDMQGQWLADRLAKFSEDLDAAIEELVRRRVQVRSRLSPDGLFIFHNFNYETIRLQSEITADTTFDVFMDKVIDRFWKVLEDALVIVRSYIEEDFQTVVYTLTDCLERDLLVELTDVNLSPLRDAIAAARTQAAVNIANVAKWFTLARNMERPDYEFGIAVEVATRSIRVCHPSLDIEVLRTDDLSFDCRGRTLESLVYVLFTALDNAIEHSGLNDERPEISLETLLQDGLLRLRLINRCAPVHDLEKVNSRLGALHERLESGTDLQNLATTEGGSGYAKIIRILRHDLLSPYLLNFGYRSQIEYAVTIEMDAKAIVK